MLIGVTGDKRAGKDSIAAVLVERFGFTRWALADPMRQALEALDPAIGAWIDGPDKYGAVRLSEALHAHNGWEGLKDSPYADEARRLCERFGTEAGRLFYGEDHWIKTLEHRISSESGFPLHMQDIVVPDIRFDNEAEWVNRNGGAIIRVSRTGTTKTQHISSRGIHPVYVSYHIENDGTKENLAEKVEEVMSDLRQHAA